MPNGDSTHVATRTADVQTVRRQEEHGEPALESRVAAPRDTNEHEVYDKWLVWLVANRPGGSSGRRERGQQESRGVRRWWWAALLVACLAWGAPAQARPFAYVTNAIDDSVSQYSVGTDDALTPLSPATVSAGADPLFVAISPDAKSVYVSNNLDGTVSQYDVGASGRLTPKKAGYGAGGHRAGGDRG